MGIHQKLYALPRETLTIIGFGSLLSEASARRTTPRLTNYRLVTVTGYRRIFNKAGIVFISRFGASRDDRAIASCATRYDGSTRIVCCAFDIPASVFPALDEREHRYHWTEVDFTDVSGPAGRGRMCTESTDDAYRCKCGTVEAYERRVGQFYRGRIWRDDLLPFPMYLDFCLDAARTHGPAVVDNFLDTSYLADGVTTIRAYLAGRERASSLAPDEIMERVYGEPRPKR